jgi:hypothetical protein
LTAANTYSGGTVVTNGTLLVNNATGSGTGTGTVSVYTNAVLGGTGTIAGVVTVAGGTISPGSSGIGTLTLNSAPIFAGTNLMAVDRNGGSPLADKVALTTGTLTYGGTLTVTNAGATLAGGETFTLFSAPSYAGAFSVINLPALGAGLNWFAGNLAVNGTITVNRAPVANTMTVTRTAGLPLLISLANVATNWSDADGNTVTLTGINLVTTNNINLTTNSTYILYTNSPFVAEQISYGISDGQGGTNIGYINIVVNGSVTGTNSIARIVTGNPTTLTAYGIPGYTYITERSTNLVGWADIATTIAATNGVISVSDSFSDLGGIPPSAAYYRLKWQP